MNEKIKILTISDIPTAPSGVGVQTRYFIESCLWTGKFKFVSLGGAMKHHNYQPMKTEEWGDDWLIIPVENYGNADIVRSVIRTEKPDILWFMTDPRFFEWLWEIEDEIRPLMPMVYYHVWDNWPIPSYNKMFYESNDVVLTISKLTDSIVTKVSPNVERHYVPHTVNSTFFKPLDKKNVSDFKRAHFKCDDNVKIFFFNSRNAKRKQTGSLVWWFKTFLDKIGQKNAKLLMHTEVKDPHGQDLEAIIRELELVNGEVLFSEQKIPPEELAMLYNVADWTVNLSDAEGFGLSTLESMACGTPIIATMTGGLQDQLQFGDEWTGIPLYPTSKAVIGSQPIPWIYEDRLNEKVVVDAFVRAYNMSSDEYNKFVENGIKQVNENFNFEKMVDRWPELMLDINKRYGSWETRKYQTWELTEV